MDKSHEWFLEQEPAHKRIGQNKEEAEQSDRLLLGAVDEVADSMSRYSIDISPQSFLLLQEIQPSSTDAEIADMLSSAVALTDPHLEKDIDNLTQKPTLQGVAQTTALAVAKTRAAMGETTSAKAKKRLAEFEDVLLDKLLGVVTSSVRSKKGLAAVATVGFALAACGKPVETPIDPTPSVDSVSLPTVIEIASAPDPVEVAASEAAPTAGADDEISVATQEVLNDERYRELGISNARVITPRLRGANRFFVVEEGKVENGNVALLVGLDKRLVPEEVFIVEESSADTSTDIRLKGLYDAYSFNNENGTMTKYESFLRLWLNNEGKEVFQIKNMDTGEWETLSGIGISSEDLTNDLSRFFGNEIVSISSKYTVEKPQVEENPPLIQPESLVLEIDGETLNELRTIKLENLKPTENQNYARVTQLTPYAGRAEELIRLMGVSGDAELSEQYRIFFDSQWVVNHDVVAGDPAAQKQIDIRGLGTEALRVGHENGKEHFGSIQDVGFFYGFAGNMIICQIVPGSDLTPGKNPEAFIAIEIPESEDEHYGLLGLRMVDEFGKAVQQYVIKDGQRVPWFEYWSTDELKEKFGLKRGAIVTILGDPYENAGMRTARAVYFQVLIFPTESEQFEGGYVLADYAKW